jgi:chromosome segregation ATPase
MGMTTNEPNVQVSANTRPCWFPNCPNLVPQNPNGRPKLTCDLMVDGLLHTRMNKSLVERGQRAVPPRGGDPKATSAPKAVQVEVTRPSEVKATMGQLMGEVQDALTGLTPLVTRMEQAARTVADQEAVTAEINATQRAARKAVDQAEAERDNALLRIRDAEGERDAALAGQQVAEEVADTALEAEEIANEQRDAAISERDAARAAETGQRDRAEGAEAELRDVKAGLERANERAEMLVDQVNAAREQASAADRLAGELKAEVTSLSDRLAASLARAEEVSRELATARESAAQQGAQLAAANQAITTAREHGEQRLRDVNELHAETVKTIRTELAETRKQLHHERDLVTAEQRTRVEVEAKLDTVRGELARVQQADRREGEPVDEHQAQPEQAAPTETSTRRVRRGGK